MPCKEQGEGETMWLSAEEEQALNAIKYANSLTEEELNYVKTYEGFKSKERLGPEDKKLPPALFNSLEDILKKYGLNEQ